MTSAQRLTAELDSVSAAEQFTFAVMQFRDGSRLHFCHRVDERWVHAIGPPPTGADPGLAGELRAAITTFRLNTKHLDIHFADGSRWDQSVECPPPDV
jgi:hypothetical protein